MELVLPMYNVHPYFSLKTVGKKCTFFMVKYNTIDLAIYFTLTRIFK